MQKLIFFLKVTVIVLCICSCYPKLRTGLYTVESVRGNTVNFKGLPDDYHVPIDTLKPGQKIYIQRTYDRKKVTVW